MKAAIIIPARYASTRLPGKALLKAGGKPVIQHTYEQARKSERAVEVVVATDDQRVLETVAGFGGKAIMTSPAHETGTGRVAEAAEAIEADIIVNLQGDEPEINPQDLDGLINLQANAGCFASTLACRFGKDAAAGPGSPMDPAAVKVILGKELTHNAFEALYFTRSLRPYPCADNGSVMNPQQYFLHVGVYAFSKTSLEKFACAAEGALERIERLEQLRILEMGERIAVGVIDEAAPGIDTLEDFQAFERRLSDRR